MASGGPSTLGVPDPDVEVEPAPLPARDTAVRRDRHQTPWFWGVIAALSVIAFLAVLSGTSNGPGVGADSTVYLGTARNFAAGRGLTTPFNMIVNPYSPNQAAAFDGRVPLTHYPPLYPAALGVFHWFGVDALDAARVFNAFLMAVNVFLAAALGLRLSRGSRIVAIASAAAVAFCIDVLLLHTYVVSEPLMLAFCLGGLVLLDRLLDRPQPLLLVGVGLCCAAAALVRYGGVALTLTAVAAVLCTPSEWFSRGDDGLRTARKRRARYGGTLLLMGAGPLFLWMAALALNDKSKAARPFAYHPPGAVDAQTAFEAVAGWFVGSNATDLLRSIVLIGVGVGVCVLTVLLVRRRERPDDANGAPMRTRPRLLIPAGFIVVYVVVLLISRTWADALIPLDTRLLAPVQVVFIVLVITSLFILVSRFSRALAAVALTAVVVIWAWPWRSGNFGFDTRSTVALVDHSNVQPKRGSLDIAAAHLPADDLIVTNAPDRVNELDGRSSIFVPVRRFIISQRVNPRFNRDIDELGRLLANRKSVLVYFGTGERDRYLPSLAELRRRIPLVQVAQFDEGSVWRAATPTRSSALSSASGRRRRR